MTQDLPEGFVPDGEAVGDGVEPMPETFTNQTPDDGTTTDTKVAELEALVGERTSDLQRLQAEYVNYKKRVDRDRTLAREKGAETVVAELLPVLDAIELARSHDELTGGFKLVADELEKIAAKYGLVAFGAIGDEFDPHRHEALMQLPMAGVSVTTCSDVMQRGYQLHDRILRPARVAVSEPTVEPGAPASGTETIE